LSNDEPSAAIAAYKAALEIYPHHETVVLIAHLMAQIGQTDQAIEFLEEKLLQPPNRTFARAPWEDRISEFLETLQPDS
jgi:tetratricopeptide (TPR) repeat protein